MHRANTAFNLALSPIAHKNFATWLLNGSNKKVIIIYIFLIIIKNLLFIKFFIISNIFQMVKNAMAAAAVRCYNSAAAEPFANGTTASYVEEMYNNWLRDPTSVHTVS